MTERGQRKFLRNGFMLCFKKCWGTKTHHGNPVFGVSVNARRKWRCHQLIVLSSNKWTHTSTITSGVRHDEEQSKLQETDSSNQRCYSQYFVCRTGPWITSCSHGRNIRNFSKHRNVPENQITCAGILVIPQDYKLIAYDE